MTERTPAEAFAEKAGEVAQDIARGVLGIETPLGWAGLLHLGLESWRVEKALRAAFEAGFQAGAYVGICMGDKR